MKADLEAAINYIKNCRQTYPEVDMMDDDVKRCYEHCWDIVRYYQTEEKQQTSPKPKKIGKLKQFEEDVLECLHQGFGEEKQLLEEAENRKNKFARQNYLRAYQNAINRYQKGE